MAHAAARRCLAGLSLALVAAACTNGPASHTSTPARSGLVMYQLWSDPAVNGALEALDPDRRSSELLSSSYWGVPSWSPDGGLVAVGERRVDAPGCYDSCSDLVLLSPSGRLVRRLTAGPGTSDTAVWSRDGRRLAYVYTDSVIDGPSHIEVVNRDGTGRRRLNREFGNPVAWFPDGANLLVVASVTDETWVIPVAGGAPRRLLPPDIFGGRDHPQRRVRILHDVILSRDGRQIFFTRDTGTVEHASTRLYSMDLGTMAVRELTSDALQPENPALSPDGKLLAFVGDLPTHKEFCPPRAVFVMPSTGGAPRRVTPPMLMGLMPPSWSSDSASLTFVAQDADHECAKDDAPHGTLYQTEVSSGHIKALTLGIAQADGIVAVQPTRRD